MPNTLCENCGASLGARQGPESERIVCACCGTPHVVQTDEQVSAQEAARRIEYLPTGIRYSERAQSIRIELDWWPHSIRTLNFIAVAGPLSLLVLYLLASLYRERAPWTLGVMALLAVVALLAAALIATGAIYSRIVIELDNAMLRSTHISFGFLARPRLKLAAASIWFAEVLDRGETHNGTWGIRLRSREGELNTVIRGLDSADGARTIARLLNNTFARMRSPAKHQHSGQARELACSGCGAPFAEGHYDLDFGWASCDSCGTVSELNLAYGIPGTGANPALPGNIRLSEEYGNVSLAVSQNQAARQLLVPAMTAAALLGLVGGLVIPGVVSGTMGFNFPAGMLGFALGIGPLALWRALLPRRLRLEMRGKGLYVKQDPRGKESVLFGPASEPLTMRPFALEPKRQGMDSLLHAGFGLRITTEKSKEMRLPLKLSTPRQALFIANFLSSGMVTGSQRKPVDW